MLKKDSISDGIYKKLSTTGSQAGILYGVGKVHKKSINGHPPFRPILSAIGTSTYKLAQYLVSSLTPFTNNCYTVKDSFSFAEEIRNQNPNLYMATFDVESLFTNIPLDETIKICVNLKVNPKCKIIFKYYIAMKKT